MSPLALFRKIHWKLRWHLTAAPMNLRNWHRDLSISLPKSGSAAQIYYRKYSEPQIAKWMEEHLRAGDCFFDIGAHVGEYSLIAAAAVGSTGSIIALEPQKDLCEIIMRNFEDNQIPNTRVIHGALGERCGRCHLFTDENTKGAVLEINSALADIPMYDLATLLKDIPADKRIWMKLDAAGYELPCLSACAEILRERPVHLILKAYSEEQVQNRFPGISQSLAEFLNSMGYRSFRITGDTPTPWDGVVHGYCEAIICESAGLTENRTQPGS